MSFFISSVEAGFFYGPLSGLLPLICSVLLMASNPTPRASRSSLDRFVTLYRSLNSTSCLYVRFLRRPCSISS